MPKFEFPGDFDVRKIDWSRFELPKFELPKFETPKMPDVDLPSSEKVRDFARDAAYVGVGFVVLTAERVQKWQQELLDALRTQFGRVRETA